MKCIPMHKLQQSSLTIYIPNSITVVSLSQTSSMFHTQILKLGEFGIFILTCFGGAPMWQTNGSLWLPQEPLQETRPNNLQHNDIEHGYSILNHVKPTGPCMELLLFTLGCHRSVNRQQSPSPAVSESDEHVGPLNVKATILPPHRLSRNEHI